MLLKVLLFLARFSVGKKLLELIDGLNERISGKRSEIILALEALLYVLGKLGVIPDGGKEAAQALSVALLGALPVTLAEKVKSAQQIGDKLIPSK